MALTEGIKRLNIPHQSPRKTAHSSPFLKGTGVAYNEAKRVTGVRGVGPKKDKHAIDNRPLTTDQPSYLSPLTSHRKGLGGVETDHYETFIWLGNGIRHHD